MVLWKSRHPNVESQLTPIKNNEYNILSSLRKKKANNISQQSPPT